MYAPFVMDQPEPFNSALSVTAGIEQPPTISDAALQRFLRKRRQQPMTVQDYVNGILQGNRTILSQAITLIESTLPEHVAQAQEIVARCMPYAGRSVRIGITGVPGVGKSTFIESLGMYLVTQAQRKLAVLAIDPSSERSKGSILGDKTRMEMLSVHPQAFIRPSPSAGSLGGVARKTRESIILCEAAGFDTVFVETVGVGQSETSVHAMTDFFLLLMISGAGDELQGIKRGIMEMADLIAINKADGDRKNAAELTRVQYQNALRLFPKTASGWSPTAATCSSIEHTGMAEIWATVERYLQLTQENGFFAKRRNQQATYWMYTYINDYLNLHFYQHPDIKEQLAYYEQQLTSNKMSPFVAADRLVQEYIHIKQIDA